MKAIDKEIIFIVTILYYCFKIRKEEHNKLSKARKYVCCFYENNFYKSVAKNSLYFLKSKQYKILFHILQQLVYLNNFITFKIIIFLFVKICRTKEGKNRNFFFFCYSFLHEKCYYSLNISRHHSGSFSFFRYTGSNFHKHSLFIQYDFHPSSLKHKIYQTIL